MYHTIVIGAGFAGLAAAKALRERGHDDILVLEARDRVGGRTKSGHIAGVEIDLGGMWLGPTQTRLKAIAEGFQVQTYPTFLEGKGVFRIAGKEHHGEGEDIDGLFGPLEAIDYLRTQRKLRKLSARLDCESPWDHPDALRLDAMTVEQWMQANMRTERLRAVFRLICYSLFCAEASQMSMLFFLHYVKSGDGLSPILSADTGGAQNFLFHGGVHQVARKMGDELGRALQTGDPVRSVEWNDDGVTVTSASGRHDARHAIVAVPATLLHRIHFTPALPQPKSVFHERIGMGSAIKYWIAYERPFWRELGFNGMVVRDDVPCAPCFDVTPPGEPKGIIAGFFDGNHAVDHGDMTAEHRRDMLVDMLAEHFGERARDPIDYVDTDWTAETWSGGCYGAYAPPGLYARYGAWLRRPVGPMHWAGTETSARWTGYIEGAIRSGERAVDEICAQLPDG